MRDTRKCRNCGETIVWYGGGRHPYWAHISKHMYQGRPTVDRFCSKRVPGRAPMVAEPVPVVRCMFHNGIHEEQKSCASAHPHGVSPSEAEAYWRAASLRPGDDVEGCDDCSRDAHVCYVCGEPVSHGLRECESHGRA